MRKQYFLNILILALFGSVPAAAAAAAAQMGSDAERNLERPVARAAQATEPPTMDGDVLGDPAWSEAPPITGFWQTAPDEGQPATERTEVRVLYTAGMLYVGVPYTEATLFETRTGGSPYGATRITAVCGLRLTKSSSS